MTRQRDPWFDDGYWTNALHVVTSHQDRQRARSLRDPASVVNPTGILAAAASVPRAVLAEMSVLYSMGAGRGDLQQCFAKVLPAQEHLAQVAARVPSTLAVLDVRARRDVYDTAVAALAWSVILDEPGPALSNWENGREDIVLTTLAREEGAVAGSVFWPETFARLAAALEGASGGAAEDVAAFLAGWLGTSRESARYGSLADARRHPEDARYHGYWAVEAAAVVELRDLDDSAFSRSPHYPRDLIS